MSNIEILMKDGCTKKEAEKLLKKGTVVFSDFEENFNKYMNEWGCDNEEKEKYENMIATKNPATDWGVVVVDNKSYYIMYVL